MTASKRALWTLGLSAALLCGAALSGCRTTESDVQKWGRTEQGPERLVAVVTHDKYPMPLRIEAAMTLATMQPRGGRRVGIPMLVEALGHVPPNERTELVQGMMPTLIAGMAKPIEEGPDGRVDPTYPYKDAAFALLTENRQLIGDQAVRDALETALVAWAMKEFESRLDDRGQTYGMQQIFREIGPRSVASLPEQIAPGANSIATMAALISEFGTPETRARASEKLVGIAKQVQSADWRKESTARLEEANKVSGHKPTPEQFEKQLRAYQDEELTRVFASMNKVGGPAVVEFLLGYAGSPEPTKEMRTAALVAVEGHLDKKSRAQADRLVALARDEKAPDVVRNAALIRLGEFPRDLVIGDLYRLIETSDSQLRRIAMMQAFKMSNAQQAEEVLEVIGRSSNGMSIDEVVTYGDLLGGVAPGEPGHALAMKHGAPGRAVGERLAALGWFLKYGTSQDDAWLKALENDTQPVPTCQPDDKFCNWNCIVQDAAGASTKKSVRTVGEVVRYCVLPATSKQAGTTEKAGAK